MMWNRLLLISVFVAAVGYSAALMCYQCTDTSDEDGKNHCQTWVRTMRKYRRIFETTGKIPSKYVKNCTGYGAVDPITGEEKQYCQIVTVESGNVGGMVSYIRGCSDRQLLFGDEKYDSWFTHNVLPNNQTTCVYDPSGFLACVTVCSEEHGDFCNGPSSVMIHQGSLLIIFVLLFATFLVTNVM